MTWWQYLLSAPSSYSPQIVSECACVRTGIVWNELICGLAGIVGISSLFCPHTHICVSSEDRRLMAQTDGAKSGYCQYDCETRLQSLTCQLDYCCSKSFCVICHIIGTCFLILFMLTLVLTAFWSLLPVCSVFMLSTTTVSVMNILFLFCWLQ